MRNYAECTEKFFFLFSSAVAASTVFRPHSIAFMTLIMMHFWAERSIYSSFIVEG